MNYGTYDAGSHTPEMDIMHRPVTDWQNEQTYQPRQTGDSPYTLARVGYSELPTAPAPQES